MTKTKSTEIKTAETITVREILSEGGKTFATLTGTVTSRTKNADMVVQNENLYDTDKADADAEYTAFCAEIAQMEAHTTIVNPDEEED